MDGPSKSNALVRKRQDTELMAPPVQAKKIKRPKKVLDEDSYTEALSQIIARDFFPGLLESQTQQEYLDALEAKDQAWISSAGRRLKHVMTPGRKRQPASIRPNANPDATPMSYAGDTPAPSVAGSTVAEPKLDVNMSLSKFQATYTSEDNESFYQLVDKQNQKKAEKYEWLWRGNNKLPSKQMRAQKQITDRLQAEGRLIDDGGKRDRLAIKDADERPARPDAWNSDSRNGLMFSPDGTDDSVPTVSQKAESESRMGPKSIVYANTRIPEPHQPKRPPSPTMSSIRDAVAGKPRKSDRDSSVVSGGETPRVNGYAFVDDEDDEDDYDGPAPIINLGPGDSNNPFKLQDQRKRESIHEKMVDDIARSKKEASRNGATGRTPHLQVPKFPSSPKVTGNLSPAAQRLWSKIGTPAGATPGTGFGEPTPSRSRGSFLKNILNRNQSSK